MRTVLLETVKSPGDLRGLGPAELERLAAEIRAFLVEAVSETGGHLGSNLGAVELTIALHRVFESPRDVLVWDTGHQAYVHKLLTGRQGDFARLRQADGLSGYPSRSESEHDVVENSHASTAPAYAFGLAVAREHGAGGDGAIVAVVGDGALTGGLAYEGLNNLGRRGSRVVVVLNDNGRSYAPTVSRLFTDAEGPSVDHVPVAAAGFFGALGFEYLGPVDGHDVGALEDVLRRAAECTGPVVVHAVTQKGRGYAPAELDPEKCLHDTSPFDPATGEPRGPGKPSYTEAFSEALLRIAERRRDVVAVTAAMPGSTGLLPFARRHPDRFVDVGIAEQHAVTAAAGMAMRGLRPVVAIYSTFLGRAWDQVCHDVGLHGLPVVFCIDRAGITGDDGPSHHGVNDLALLTKVPGMTVLAPSSYEEVGVMLEEALTITSGPVAIRWPKTPARHSGETGQGLRARRLCEGRDVCLLGVGKMLEAAEDAAALLAQEGVSSTVWDVRCVAPLDSRMLADARRHAVVVTVEDGIAEGGAGAHVMSAFARTDGGAIPRVAVLGVPPAYLPQGKPVEILASLGLDGPGVAAAARKALEAAEA